MQNPVVINQHCSVHWRLSTEPHDQHIAGLPALIIHLAKSNPLCLL
jgi:hypothetical protein